MRRFVILLVALLLAHAAVADQNPDIRVYLDFDPPNEVNRIDPEPGTIFDVYVVLDCFGPGGGTRGLSLAFERTFDGYVLDQTSLLGGVEVGDVEDPYIGWAYVAGADCVYPGAGGLVVTGYVTYYYAGEPGHIRVLRTEFEQGLTLDCNVDVDYYCIAGHAGVGMDAPPGESGCVCGGSPVEEGSWSTIKALYR